MNRQRTTTSYPDPHVAVGLNYYQNKLGKECFAPAYWPTWLVLLFLWVCVPLPLAMQRGLGAAFGLLMMTANTKRRRIAAINLGLCFPNLSSDQRRHMLRRHFVVKGQSYVDLGFLAWASRRRIQRKVRFSGMENYRAVIDQGRNVIFLAPHCVGMNVGASVLAREHACFSMKKAQHNPLANWLLNKGRARFGLQLVLRDQGLRPVIRGVKQGISFYYLPDEDFGTRSSVFAPFFGVPRATLTTLGRLAHLTNAAVVPCFTRLLPGGRGYEVTLKPALTDFPSGDRLVDAARMNQEMELGIQAMPEQYMWTLRFFRTRPDNSPSLY
jgi:Kdo2-lipid IVA lauroyltransferase/acyltransferase